MKKYLYIIAALIVMNLSAVNQMELMQTFTNNIPHSSFGKTMAALNFNNDEYDDLAIFSYSDNAYNFGSINIYLGSAVMDSVADIVISAQFAGQYTLVRILNAGDVNGDSIEDLLVSEQVQDDNHHTRFKFYYGSTNPDTIPDYDMLFENSPFHDPGAYPNECLGDVNADGFDDIGLICFSNDYVKSLKILLGGSFTVVTVIDSISLGLDDLITRAGDMNGDGMDDFTVAYAPRLHPEPEYPRYRYIYFGGNR